ncbi:rbr family ring finger and ibr domain-containing [Holotrichia oblita]|uniref:Rbr family ring finger and ibr domain-containing n=1 Tax=Holotrichia oblita TaxID=644536 RepID=A0ACB9TLB7_HOLOL|nr:rbr family ring finger and ibr domain-containing [Holotrichia oblita]
MARSCLAAEQSGAANREQAMKGMKHLLRTFLNDLGGNPNKKNGLNETVLHCACQLNHTKSFSAQERRAACVQLLLYWKGVPLATGGREKVDLSAQDKEGNTALHWAASTGLKRCVELLLTHGAPLFIENNDKLTPCDLAMRAAHHDIARLLESRMVFVKWSREVLLEKWMKDPVECCQLAGVQAPASVLQHAGSIDSNSSPENCEDFSNRPEIMCEICFLLINNWEQPIMMSCKHVFCKRCWESYLTIKIQDGDAHHILCPAYQCHILVPVELIEKLVSPDMARRYLQFDIKAFVESNKSIKWCPIPGCGRAVRLPEAEQTGAVIANKTIPVTSHAVDCGNAHFFCWECLGEAHAPCGCKQWQEWQMKIGEVKPEELQASCSGSEDAANILWLVTNSKPCPNCKSPIQKNEGCNHMKCSKCKFDFCWVCQESWKRHSSATGGYFRCNRFEAVHKADEKQGSLISEALDRNNQMQEMSRFLHFYTRFKNHENSQKLEEPLLITIRQKMELLACSLGLKSSEESGEKGTKFIEDGVRELLKARRVLCGSYVYGYYLEDDGYNKTIFEFMQNELEEVTEKLSEMIARPYLRTPKAVIVQTTNLARRKRHEFVRAVAQGLIPPETPPAQRKAKKRRYLDTELSQTSAWLRDCQWPEYDSDLEEGEYKPFLPSDGSPRDHQCGAKCSNLDCRARADYNMELVIALEMSRLQMIEDRIKRAQANAAITPDPSSSISNNSNDGGDDQIKLAIQLSLQDSTDATNGMEQKDSANSSQQGYQRTKEDITVDCFLKSLANKTIDFKNLEVDVNMLDWNRQDKECLFKPCNGNEDGRFQISEIHEKGFAFADSDEYDDSDVRLKRSHSTGDLCTRRSGRGTRIRTNGDEPRYHLDSDHSSQHDDKPEDIARKILALPSSSIRTKQFVLLHQTYPEEEVYQGQSSVEDTTTSDSINADMEVCGILESVTDDDLGSKASNEDDYKLYVNVKKDHSPGYVKAMKKTENISSKCEEIKTKQNPFASLKAKICLLSEKKKDEPEEKQTETKDVRRNSDHSLTFKKELTTAPCIAEEKSPKTLRHSKVGHKGNCFSKSTGFLLDQRHIACKTSSNLRIKICKSPETKCRTYPLETDSSNEYESETGIPKSPTLFISGVSISRTPEPKSPGISLITSSGRQSRSSSLSVPVPLSTCSLNISSTSLNANTIGNTPLPPEPFTPSLVRSTTPATSRNNVHSTPNGSPSKSSGSNKENTKSKSASEPEREREMFRFPKSSTDGALSSVLHVQESNLSSDDFHEALFLLERSPKTRDSKRRKKSKKKDKEERKEEASSAL